MAKSEDRSQNHSLIHVEPSNKESLSVAEFFTNKFDYVLKADMYKPYKNTLAVYDLYRQIMIDKDRNIKTPIITLSPDTAISGSTLAGAAEKFMYSDTNTKTGNPYFRTNLKVIYIDASPDLSTRKYREYSDFSGSVLADVMGLTENTFNLHRVDIPPENIYLVGVDEESLDDEQEGYIRKHNINIFSLQTMKKKGIAKIMKHIINQCKFDDVQVIIDLSCMQIRYTPSVYRSNDGKNGFDFDQMRIITQSLKQLQRLNGVDVTGYNFGHIVDKEKHHTANMLTVKTIEMITSSLITLNQQSINIFNEESRFLIWKRVDDTDLGWLILRGMNLQQREEMIKLIGDNDGIITITIPEDEADKEVDKEEEEEDSVCDYFVTITSMKEQQEKSYYMAKSVTDCCLYPGEKLNMMFELLNTPSQQAILNTQSTESPHRLTNNNLEDNDSSQSEKLDRDVKKNSGKRVTFVDKELSQHPRFAKPVKYTDTSSEMILEDSDKDVVTMIPIVNAPTPNPVSGLGVGALTQRRHRKRRQLSAQKKLKKSNLVEIKDQNLESVPKTLKIKSMASSMIKIQMFDHSDDCTHINGHIYQDLDKVEVTHIR